MAGAAITMLVTLAVALSVMSLLFSRHIERQVAEDLERDALRIVASLAHEKGSAPHATETPSDERYDTPAGGRYWQLTSPSGSSRSLSLWDESLPVAPKLDSDRWSVREADGPFEQRVLLVERTVTHAGGGTPVTVQLAQDVADLRVARDQFRRELALFLLVLWLMLMAASWVQVHLGLRPLGLLRAELVRMRRSPSERLDGRYPSEVVPLTSAINRLAEARERDVLRARRRAADLAHSLKTPLAAMAALGRRLQAGGDEQSIAPAMERVIASAGAALEAELARSRAASIRDGLGASEANPTEVAERIFAVVERTERGGALVYDLDMAPSLRLPLASDDLTEVLGALVENAARFARRQVRLSGRATAEGISLCVEDDGPGLGISIDEALARGGRLDEAGAGNHGLGLSIARDIVEATQGTLELGRSPSLGGLQVRMLWPVVPAES